MNEGKENSVEEPKLPRARKAPKRFQIGTSEGSHHEDVKSYFCQIYFEKFDTLIACIKSRFNQEGYKVLRHIEELLLRASNEDSWEDQIEFVANFYHDDLNRDVLSTQLQLMPTLFETTPVKQQDIRRAIESFTAAQKIVFDQVIFIIILLGFYFLHLSNINNIANYDYINLFYNRL